VIWRSCREPERTTSCSDRLSEPRGKPLRFPLGHPPNQLRLSRRLLAAMENPVLRSGFPTTARPFRAFKRLRVENAARLPHSDRRSRSTSSVFIYQMEGRRREAATPERREPPAGATWFALCGILREGKPLNTGDYKRLTPKELGRYMRYYRSKAGITAKGAAEVIGRRTRPYTATKAGPRPQARSTCSGCSPSTGSPKTMPSPSLGRRSTTLRAPRRARCGRRS